MIYHHVVESNIEGIGGTIDGNKKLEKVGFEKVGKRLFVRNRISSNLLFGSQETIPGR
ncbi:hypothetical protein KUV50_03450 [Membranicola marinus]|uniref:Uncharacterized protein n=1 Tax=Membranihabitans marinus TaxID=1227546 RepID=A0A953LA12_9BACT|nr:hypothetical protein [Membranihabitans marinus]MBY5957176.1 hypothetical protein [Membranihabitans marinus]